MIEVEGERVITATMMGGLANYLGCAEPALRLLISIFLGKKNSIYFMSSTFNIYLIYIKYLVFFFINKIYDP